MMNDELLDQLTIATTEEDRWNIIIQSHLQTLPEELSKAAWAIAVPHWFDKSILSALLPQLNNKTEEIYQQLIILPFVQVFPGRGYNIFQTNRKVMLRYLWRKKRQEFLAISERARQYFSQYCDQKPEAQIEYFYHLVIIDPDKGAEEIKEICAEWNNQFRFAELEFLVNTLLEQVKEDRVQGLAKAVILYRQGRSALRLDQTKEVLEEILTTLYIANNESHQDEELQADILQAIGDTLTSLDKYEEASQKYNQALNLYKKQDDKLNIANVMQSLGKVSCRLKEYKESFDNYLTAIDLFYIIDDTLGKANTFYAISKLLKKITKNFNSSLRSHIYEETFKLFPEPIGHTLTLRKLTLFFHKKALELYSNLGYTLIAKDRTERQKNKKTKDRNPRQRFYKESSISPREIPDLIHHPIVTEKAIRLIEENKYVFSVKQNAIKPDIKKAIESLFDVKVIKVNTLNPPRKKRRVGKFLGYKPHYKKAIVTLAEGDSIDLFPEV
jgi:large subunit ribosomal protein L23